MLLTIQGLPNEIRYQDLKALIIQECKISDFILDGMVTERDGKKIRIGTTDDADGQQVMRCLNGYQLYGSTLRVAPIGKSAIQLQQQNQNQTFNQQSFQPRNDYNKYHDNMANPNQQPNYSAPINSAPWQSQANPGLQTPGTSSAWSNQNPQPSFNNYQPRPVHSFEQQQTHPPIGQPAPQEMYNNMMPNQNQNYNRGPVQPVPNVNIRNEIRSSLRAVEIVDSPAKIPLQKPNEKRFPNQYDMQNKPMTINRDNFQGARYNSGEQKGSQGFPPPLQEQQQSKWIPVAQQPQGDYNIPKLMHINMGFNDRNEILKRSEDPSINARMNNMGGPGGFNDRRVSPGIRRRSPGIRRHSPGIRRNSPSMRSHSPGIRRHSPGMRRHSPGMRRHSPGMRRHSPGNRRETPDRRMSPKNRRMSPNERRLSPGGRRASPDGRKYLPGGRGYSPRGNVSPGGRGYSPRGNVSPGRSISPDGRHSPPRDRRGRRSASGNRIGRYSPGRRSTNSEFTSDRYSPSSHFEEEANKFIRQNKMAETNKFVKPAYELPQAPNQAMYSGGFRPNVQENLKYPVPGPRQPEKESRNPWQEETSYAPQLKKKDDLRMQYDDRMKHSPRNSRSPERRDRTRYNRHSTSPNSPRRSWALEKPNSPDLGDAPPPPIWPGQETEDKYEHQKRDDDKRMWEPYRPTRDIRSGRRDEERTMDDRRQEMDLPVDDRRYPQGDRYSREPRPTSREGFSRFDRWDKPGTPEIPVWQKEGREHQRPQIELPNRGEIRERIEELKKSKLDRELEDVHKRAVEFRKKTEELRKAQEQKKEAEARKNEHGKIEIRFGKPVQRGNDEKNRQEKYDDRQFSRHTENEERKEQEHTQKVVPPWSVLSTSVKVKREKAVEEIAQKVVHKNGLDLSIRQHLRIYEELTLTLSRIINEMFGDKDVSFIEIVIKFNAKYNDHALQNIFEDVMKSFPSHYWNLKRTAAESLDHAEKSFKRSNDFEIKKDENQGDQIPEFSQNCGLNISPLVGVDTPQMMPMTQTMPVTQIFGVTPQHVPVFSSLLASQQMLMNQQIEQLSMLKPACIPNIEQPYTQENMNLEKPVQEDDRLYLCKDDFEPYTDNQAEMLRKFLVNKIYSQTAQSQGWAPSFTIKGLQSLFRYELLTSDPMSRAWLLNLDFSEFHYFNVLVYTKEELWYERAAIWLPGHSKYRSLEPLEKLRLQNKKLDELNIHKWKMVKNVTTAKGTRLYVDMPPSSARALEKHKMLLSYELQKVNVFLKAVAVDKDAFDRGLKEYSITDPNEIIEAIDKSPMPSLSEKDCDIIKICLKGNKCLNLGQARKVKEMVIFHIFKYHQSPEGECRTDFVKFGFCKPGFFGVVADNSESKKWLTRLDIGKLNKHVITVVGADRQKSKFLKMAIYLPISQLSNVDSRFILQTLKQSNKGVKGLNVDKWANVSVPGAKKRNQPVEVSMDLASVEAISKMKSQLDFYLRGNNQSVKVKSVDMPGMTLQDILKKYKNETSDNYNNDNMDLASSDDDVMCIDDD